MHDCKSVEAGGHVVEHNAGAVGKGLQLTYRRWFEDVEEAKQYKACEKWLPYKWDANEGDELTGDFVDDNDLWILPAGGVRDFSGSGNSDDYYENGKGDRNWNAE